MARSTRVALALGMGGARGYAHIGVIQVLEERGYDIVSLAGTSMGAVIGGLHAADKLDAYADWVGTLTQRDVLRLMDPTLKAPGAIRAEKVFAKVAELLDGARIEDLPIPFTAVATDLLTGREVWFQEGLVSTAIRASVALPSFISPVMLNGRLLADGGLLNPVPVAATAASSSADLTIAVLLSEAHRNSGGMSLAQDGSEPSAMSDRVERSRRSLAQMLDGDLTQTITNWFTGAGDTSPIAADDEVDLAEQLEEAPFDETPPGLRTLDVMQLSLEALQGAVTRYRLAAYPPDLLITIPKTTCRTLDFHRANEMIAIGRERAAEALDDALPAQLS